MTNTIWDRSSATSANYAVAPLVLFAFLGLTWLVGYALFMLR